MVLLSFSMRAHLLLLVFVEVIDSVTSLVSSNLQLPLTQEYNQELEFFRYIGVPPSPNLILYGYLLLTLSLVIPKQLLGHLDIMVFSISLTTLTAS